MKDSVRFCGMYCHSVWLSLPPSPIRLERETVCFVVASVLDILMTYTLLTHDAGEFIESNPIARFVIEAWGFTGMVLFKLFFTTIVVLIAQFIARHKLLTAQRLYHFSTGLVGSVVLYSTYLMMAHS